MIVALIVRRTSLGMQEWCGRGEAQGCANGSFLWEFGRYPPVFPGGGGHPAPHPGAWELPSSPPAVDLGKPSFFLFLFFSFCFFHTRSLQPQMESKRTGALFSPTRRPSICCESEPSSSARDYLTKKEEGLGSFFWYNRSKCVLAALLVERFGVVAASFNGV